MRLNQFSYLVAISECGSIIDASRKLFVSQPSVSAAVRELEEELGFEILIRSRRGVEFTPMGEKVLESARTIIKEQERIQSLSQKKAICGNISVGGSSFFFDSVILNTIIKLRERYPDLIITARENDTANLFPMVQNGRLSIGVVLCCHVDKKAYEERIKRYGLNSVEILEDEMVFLTRNNHPLALKGEAPLKEILQ